MGGSSSKSSNRRPAIVVLSSPPAATHPTTIRELHEKISKLTSENLKSREQYNELNRQNHELQDTKLMLTAKNESLMDQEKLLVAENDILNKKVDVLEKEAETLKKENKTYQEMFSGFELGSSSGKTIKGDECCLCLEGPIRFAINKCGHAILCEKCGDCWTQRLLKDCPLCRKPVESVLKLSVNASADEYRLLEDLRKEYDPVERPIGNHSEALDVKLRVILYQILEIDEKNQMLTIVIWLQMTWNDYKMVWAPAEYGNITRIALPPDMLWKPDIMLFNSADENFDARSEVNFVVSHTGEVLHAPPAIVKSSCAIDITWFPFDEQICYLKLNLYIDKYNTTKNNRMDRIYYLENGAWELVGTPASRNSYTYEGDLYIELYFYMYLRRKVIYYGINWIMPSILFLFCNVLGFSLPAECETTNLLSVTVFLGMVAEVTPPTSMSVPFIGAFFALQMVLLGSSVIITILVINLNFRKTKTHRMSPFMRTLFLEWLPWLMLMNRPGTKFKRPKRRAAHSASSSKSTQGSSSYSSEKFHPRRRDPYGNSNASLMRFTRLISNHRVASASHLPLHSAVSVEHSGEENENATDQPQKSDLLNDTLIQLSEYLRESKQQMIDDELEEMEQADWRFMAMAIDRACMFVYAFLSVFIPFCMYISTPIEKDRLYEDDPLFHCSDC
ncbi:Neuronal acetylcholine receptor subunit eat-2 [Aphelenchoides bicaudatus]|nr:Neuronal acetylcholine receptor subunit eat-2 [Aphelenchoides bicaudatus]